MAFNFKVLWRVLLFGVLVVYSVASVEGQGHEQPYPITCEEAVYHVSDAMLQHSKRKHKDASMIIILRPGKNESQKLIATRLKSIKAFVESFESDVTPVYGSSERVGESGLLDIFVEGVRIYRLPILRNKDIDFTTCSV